MVVADELEQIYVAAAHRSLGVADALIADAERRIRRPATVARGWRSCRATLAPGGSTSAVGGPTRDGSSTQPRPGASPSRFPPGATSRRCKDLAQPRGELVRLAGLAVLAAEEPAVIARERDRRRPEALGDGLAPRWAISPSDSSPAARTIRVDAARSASKSGS